MNPGTEKEKSAIEAAVKQCFASNSKVAVSLFVKALQKRKVATCNNLTRIIESTDYLAWANNNEGGGSYKENFCSKGGAKHSGAFPGQAISTPASVQVIKAKTSVLPLSVNCDMNAIVDVLGNIAIEHLDLEDTGVTDVFIDVGSNLSCVQLDKVVAHSDVSTVLEQLPGGGPNFKESNRVIFGRTLHRLAAVTYDDVINGIAIRVGRSVSGLLPVFEGLVEQNNVLLCDSPNVGGHIVGISRVFRPVDPAKQYATLLDCVRNHLPDVIAVDELNTKDEVDVCQTIALRSIQMVASVHGNIQDLVLNSMLKKALGGSTQALVSDGVAIDGRKVVVQRTTRPIFDVVINITRTSHELEYTFIENVADNVSRIMQGKSIQIRKRRLVGKELLESKEEVLYPWE
ncbi:MAG: hypothetical protein BYD32DRAFT_439539 [Podila humilis]|nr:MAG: hypothetical protein BYD32DRAFT_439539 [Podila humilis]